MAGSVSDEAFARAAQQAGFIAFDDIEAARAIQADRAKKGVIVALADVLIQRGVITTRIRENIEKKILADQQTGGIKQLGPYKLLKKLGEGGMGAVYLADDTSVGRKVAVKVLPKKYSEEREFLTRFRREAQATGRLNHVNIVTAYNVGEDTGTHYYAMEYCEGDTLDRILKRDKMIPWDAATAVVLQVARGLKHAHHHGIIHRDIKPANIFICKPLGTPEGGQVETFAEGFVAKILDLGLSKNISGNEQSFYTQTGVALGTPHYISPEQAKGEKGIDGRTDIYSLGATFYHLVTGQTPFEASTALAILNKHLTEQLTNPQDINESIPDGVAQVIIKMMAKEPADRYANCTELLDDLELVIDGKMPSSQAIDVGKSSVAVARAPRRVATAPRKTAGPLQPAGARPHQPAADRRSARGKRADDVPMQEVPAAAPANRRNVYIGAGVLGLGTITFIAALAFSGKQDAGKSDTATTKPDSLPATPDTGTGRPTTVGAPTEQRVWPLHDGKEPVAEYAKRVGLPAMEALDLGGGVKMEFVLVPAGEFMMGDENIPDAKPVHKVTITKPFYLGKYEVTHAQYERVMGANPSRFKGADLPVENVSWDDANKFCETVTHLAKLRAAHFAELRGAGSQKNDSQFGKMRYSVGLPTEAQWEHACRAGTTTEYCSGKGLEALKDVGWCSYDGKWGSAGRTKPVGSFKPNAWGLYDMHGNVWEWCEDRFGDYRKEAVADPQEPAAGNERTLRGGSCSSDPGNCGSGSRKHDSPGRQYWDSGFRVRLGVWGGATVAIQPQTRSQKPETGVTDAWIKSVQAQPAEKQVEEVVKKLKEMNPGWNGKETHGIKGDKVVNMALVGSRNALQNVASIAPLGAFKDLCWLDIHDTAISELAPLKGLPIGDLQIYGTNVTDLSPLEGMTLSRLHLWSTKVTNLAPLRNVPLKAIACDFVPERDAAILRSIKTLEKINGIPVAEFWKKCPEAGTAKAAAGGERPWKAIFDGKTLDCFADKGSGQWRVENGALTNVPGVVNAKWVTNEAFGDGYLRVRFEIARSSWLQFNTYAGPPASQHRVVFGRPELTAMAGTQQELIFSRRGTSVLASVAGQPVQVALVGPPNARGLLAMTINDGTIRVFNIEYRELPAATQPETENVKPETRLEVGQKDNDGWTCIFNGRDLTGWGTQRGKPRVEEQAVVLQENAGISWPSTASAFELRGSIRLIRGPSGRGSGAIEFAGAPEFLIRLHNSGDVHLIGPGDAPLARSGLRGIAPDTWQSFVVRLVGSAACVIVESKTILQASSFAARPTGLVLRTYGGETEVRFKDLWLRELGPDGKPLGAAQPDAGALPKELSLDLGGGVKMEFVLVPAGEFDMGDDSIENAKPKHRVKITKPFYLGKYEVTQAQYEKIMGTNPSPFKGGDLPVHGVSWDDAQAFCKGTSKIVARAMQLPTEAQWEYACRAGTVSEFNTGDGYAALGKTGWYENNAGGTIHRVGQKTANAWGLCDMHGNVDEWCEDWYRAGYPAASPSVDPTGPAEGTVRVHHGGFWLSIGTGCRSSSRGGNVPRSRDQSFGFRVAVPAKAP